MANFEGGFRKYLTIISNRLLETAIWTFTELGIADVLTSDKTVDELAQDQNWNSDYLYRLLRLVADADIVREIQHDGKSTKRFELTDDGLYLKSTHPSQIREMIRWELGPYPKTEAFKLPELIRSPTKQAKDNRQTFEYLHKEENQELARTFNKAMSSFSIYSGEPVVRAVDFSRFNKIVDIGGGLGSLLSSILQHYPTIQQGISFDLPQVIQQAQTHNELETANIPKHRYEFVSGDMFNSTTIPHADAYLMKNILHDWNDQQAIEILRSIRAANQQRQITLFIIESVILNDNEHDAFYKQYTHAFDLHMLIVLDAKERTSEQYQALFEQSGFQLKTIHRTSTPYSIIEATAN